MRLTVTFVRPITGKMILALLAMICSPAASEAEILGFGNFSQYTLNQNDTGSPPTISSGTIEITNGGGETRSLFYDAPQNISNFTASFTYSVPAGGSSVFDFDPSAAFVIQNSPQGANAIGSSGSTSGYGGITNSAAVSLELSGSAVGGNGSSGSGLFTGGSVGSGATSTAPVNLTSGDPVNVVLSYNGSSLTETLTDTVTSSVYSTTYLTNLTSAIGGSTAYVGFTAATSNSTTQNQFLSNFQFTASPTPEPSSVVMLAIGAAGLLCVAIRRRRRVAVSS